MSNILVLKLGALGDIFAATSAFDAIRQHHPQDHITLLTTKPFTDFAHSLGLFDDIWIDDRPKFTKFGKLWQLRKKLRAQSFRRVYDLQMVDRTNFYSHLIGPTKRPEWVGTALGASHRYHLPKQPTYHQDRLKGLLKAAGITTLPTLNLTRLAGDIQAFPLKFPYVLIVPGASVAHRDTKCWPQNRYGEVCVALTKEGFTPVIVGGPDEDNHIITDLCPQAIDLTGKTKLMDMITLATHAAFAIGNDTGPMHIASTCLCPVLALFFGKNDPAAVGPRGIYHQHIYAPEKEQLDTQAIIDQLPSFIEIVKNKKI